MTSRADAPIVVELPWPTGVTTNGLYRRDERGFLRLTRQAQAWKDEAMFSTRIARGRRRIALDPFVDVQRFSLRIDVYPPDRRRRDLDNLVKLAQDSVCQEAGIDDSRIYDLWVHRAEVEKPGRLVVTLGAAP